MFIYLTGPALPAKDLVIQGNRMVQLAGSDLLTMGGGRAVGDITIVLFLTRGRLFI